MNVLEEYGIATIKESLDLHNDINFKYGKKNHCCIRIQSIDSLLFCIKIKKYCRQIISLTYYTILAYIQVSF